MNQRRPRILIVGDAMVDRYHFGTATRVSPEAPIPVVRITSHETFNGGAANVFTNLVTLGAEVRLRAGEPTPIKNRLMVGTTQVARWDEEDKVHPIPLEALETPGWEPEAIVVSDYGKGSVNQDVINWINAQRVPMYVDTKRDPMDFYIGGTYPQKFFPNLQEYGKYKESYDSLDYVILKRSAEGIQDLAYGKCRAEFPAYARNVVSVCGAGDTTLAVYVYFESLGDPSALFKASIAAAVVVEKPGTATATVAEIEERIRCLDTKKVSQSVLR